ncbi:MAG: late competence development ComFB family protein [Spirochaetaceae bacterium]|jgi:competence protein ComFB|nr:late competence development ComFB family protein [Spirochaetaceae bacterium]
MFEEIHNINEEIVFSLVKEICKGNEQSMLDIACWTLNQLSPRYMVSNRGVVRYNMDAQKKRQYEADITAIIHEGIKRINGNPRGHEMKAGAQETMEGAMFNIPIISGRAFNGKNFEPLEDATITLLDENGTVTMKTGNWQNPFKIVRHTAGAFSFLPESALAEKQGLHKNFLYSIKIEAEGLETMMHHFEVPVQSEYAMDESFSVQRSYTLNDLFLFPYEGED